MTEPQPLDYDKIRIPCSECGGEMVVRRNKENGARFMGCTNWPPRRNVDTGGIDGCSHTQPIPQYFLLRAQGAQALPGFE